MTGTETMTAARAAVMAPALRGDDGDFDGAGGGLTFGVYRAILTARGGR